MKKSWIVALSCIGTLLLGSIVFFAATPVGREIMTDYVFHLDKASEDTYTNRKKVEETLRAYYASYLTDKASYEQYKDSTDEYYYNLAQSYRQRANSTAITYNEYFTKNSFVFADNIPADLPTHLDII